MKKIWIVGGVMVAVTVVFWISCRSSATRDAVGRGQKIYTQYCLSCHQPDGGGVSELNPPLKNTAEVVGEESRLIGIVVNGFSGDADINGNNYTNPMPAFGPSLKDDEIADVLTYVRNSFGDKASEISAGQVKAVRK